MEKDKERIASIKEALEAADLDMLVGSLPANVLMISGYWPVIGTALAIVTREGQVILVVPEDEEELAVQGWHDDLYTFRPGSLRHLSRTIEAVRTALKKIAHKFSANQSIGFENSSAFEPYSYAAVHVYGAGMIGLLKSAFANSALIPADDLISQLKARKTAGELVHIHKACDVAKRAFVEGARQLRPGLREYEAAELFRAPLHTAITSRTRAGGFTFCMSGPNSAKANRSYARSYDRELQRGDLVLVHCNSYVDGYWTDITRTYCLGTPDQQQAKMYSAVLTATDEAIAVIRHGVSANDVDETVRDALKRRGCGESFTHSTGHGVGFAAINHSACPRLHPLSDDKLEVNMVFNVEPAIYLEGFGGLRHCNMVTIGDNGPDLLTPFQSHIDELTIH